MISIPISVTVDPIAIRQDLSLTEPVDIRSPLFQRFIIRLSERLDVDIPREDYPLLATVGGCFDYITRSASTR